MESSRKTYDSAKLYFLNFVFVDVAIVDIKSPEQLQNTQSPLFF